MEMLLEKIDLPPATSSEGDPFYYVSLINVTQGAFCVFDEYQVREIVEIGEDTQKVKDGVLKITEVIRNIPTRDEEITKKYNNLVYSIFPDCDSDRDFTEDFDKTIQYINGAEVGPNFDPLFELTSKKLSGEKGAGGLRNLQVFEVQYSTNWLQDYFGEPQYWKPEGKERFILAETMCWGNKNNYYLIPLFIGSVCVGGLAFFFEDEMGNEREKECNRRAEIFFRKNEYSHPIFNNIIRNYYTFGNYRFFKRFCKSKPYESHAAYRWANINLVKEKAKTLDEAIRTSYRSHSLYSEPIIRLVSPSTEKVYCISIDFPKDALEAKNAATRLLAYMHANPVFQYYTNHGVYHSYNVLSYAEHIIDQLGLILNNYELFILYLGAYYHDMGMLLRSEEYSEIEYYLENEPDKKKKSDYLESKRIEIRDKHNNERLDYFFNNIQAFTFEIPPTVFSKDYDRVRNDLYRICRAHRRNKGDKRRGDTLNESEMRDKTKDSVLNKRLIGAILRLSDTMDYACDRLPSIPILSSDDVPETSIKNYMKHAASIRLVLSRPTTNKYLFSADISKPQLEGLVEISRAHPHIFPLEEIQEGMKDEFRKAVRDTKYVLKPFLGNNEIEDDIDVAKLDV